MALKHLRVIKIWTDCLCYHVQTAQTQEDKILRKSNPSSAHQSLLCCEQWWVIQSRQRHSCVKIQKGSWFWRCCDTCVHSFQVHNKTTWTIFSFFMWHLRGQIRLFCVSSSGSICWAVGLGVVLTYLTEHAKYSPRSSANGCCIFETELYYTIINVY